MKAHGAKRPGRMMRPEVGLARWEIMRHVERTRNKGCRGCRYASTAPATTSLERDTEEACRWPPAGAARKRQQGGTGNDSTRDQEEL